MYKVCVIEGLSFFAKGKKSKKESETLFFEACLSMKKYTITIASVRKKRQQ